MHDDLDQAGTTQAPRLLDAALRLVTTLTQATVRGADGVSITLERHGQLTTVAASDDTIRRMDDHQYTTGEGPCLAAATEGRWFHSDFLTTEHRWPRFTPLALADGIVSILSTPVSVPDGPIGAVNIYSRTGGAFGRLEREVAALFAGHAADVLCEVVEIDGRRAVRISDALTAREVIAMAQGVHMARRGASAEDAAAELHRAARAKEITVRAEALTVLASTHTTGPPAEVDRG